MTRNSWFGLLAFVVVAMATSGPAAAQQQQKPNILFIMGDDIGWMQPSIVVFTTDNGAETATFPDGGITPFKGQKGGAWEGGYRVYHWSCVGLAISSPARCITSCSRRSIGCRRWSTSPAGLRART